MRETLSQCRTRHAQLEKKIFLLTLFLGKISCHDGLTKVFLCVSHFLVELGKRRCVCPSCCTHDDIDWSATVFSCRRTGWPCAMCSKHTSVHTSLCQCLFQPPRNGISSSHCVWCKECYKQIWAVSPQLAHSVQVFLYAQRFIGFKAVQFNRGLMCSSPRVLQQAVHMKCALSVRQLHSIRSNLQCLYCLTALSW